MVSDNNDEIEKLSKKPINELIENIKSSLDIIINFRVNEEIDKLKNSIESLNEAKEYENLLQEEEERIRKLLAEEISLKLQCEKYAQNLDILEQEKNSILEQIVSEYSLKLILYIIRKEKEVNIANI